MSNEYRIFGPPGCGKTTYLGKQVLNAVEKHGADSLLLASFTKTAAAELAGRKLPVSQERIGTLHSHCFRALNNPKVAEAHIKQFNEDDKTYTLTPQSGQMDEGASDISYEAEHDEIFAEYQVLRARMVPREHWPLRTRGFAKHWEQWKSDCGFMDFTDMIENAIKWVERPPYGATIGVFDEVQDFTPLQLSLIRKWGQKLDFFLLAGDDDQTLYTFTGATPDAFLKPDIDPKNKIILNQSYRVPRAPQQFAQTIIKQIRHREQKEYRPRDNDGELRILSNVNWKEPRNLLEDMNGYLDQGKSVMVLAACGYMLNKVLGMFREEGLTFYNPYRVARGDWNPLKGGENSTRNRLLEFLNPTGPKHGNTQLWSPKQLAAWIDIVGVTDILNRGSKQKIINFAAQGDNYDNGEYFKMLVEAFKPQALNEAITRDPKFILNNVTSAKRKQVEYINLILGRNGVQALEKRPQICVGTIHSVKGGQADVVYLFPDLSLNGQRAYTGGTGDQWESVVRQFYVGVTRCKESLIVCAPAGGWYVRELIL